MTPHAPEASYPLSPLQQGMLFHALTAPGSGVDIEQMVCTLREEIDAPALRAAWQRVTKRHSILRTSFCWEESPLQDVWAEAETPWIEIEFRAASEAVRQEHFEQFLREDRRRGLAMNQAPLMRLTLFRFGARDFRLVWTFHHALLDGRSFPIVLREVFALYESREISAAPRPYRDYIAWLQTRHPAASEPFWRDLLRGFTAPTPLVIEGIGDLAAQPAQGDAEVRIPAEATAALREIAAREQITLNTLVQGAWALVLSRYSGEDDVVFGATRACRRSTIDGAEDMVGLFINTLPVRARLDPNAPLLPWLKELRAQWIAMRPHEHTPLASVQAWSDVPGGRSLFDSIVVFENYELNELLGAGDTRSFRLHEQTNFGLTLAAYAGPDLLLRIEFNRARFAAESIARMLDHLRVVLESFARNPAQRLGEVPLLTAEEHVFFTGKNFTPPQGGDATLHELFAQQAARTPGAIALVCGDARLTYAELDARASALAGHLRALGVGPEVIVGLCMERSNDLIVGLLAILKAGGAYLPIDLAYPPERLAFMLEDAQAPVLLTQSHLAAKLPAHAARIVCVDIESPSTFDVRPSTFDVHASALAYVIYTSGSTGKPKGCCITNRNVVRLFEQTDDWFHFGASDVWTMFHSVAFDFSVWEIWGALLYGGRLVVVPHEISRSPEAFHELLCREQVTVLNQTPSAFRQLIAADGASTSHISPLTSHLSLRLVIFGGEALEMQSLKPWFDRHADQRPQLVNMYGITETTVHVTYRPLSAADLTRGSVIGKPIPDLQLHILDPALRPVPIGIPGEIFVGGGGVARGYLRRPELTATRFIDSPFTDHDSHFPQRLYRTGDLARWLPGGDIEYLGRIDQQVKIRGFRIELGEIESILVQHPAVREAAVLARAEGAGERRLVAYIVPRSELPPVTELRAHLKTRLPDYMVPAAFVTLDRLPLTQNGKLDQRALPAPEPERPELAAAFVAPRTPNEKTLAGVWRKVLRLERVGVHDNFFELGGDSILSILIISQARRAGLPLSPKHLFDHQTIAELALAVPEVAAPADDEPATGESPLTPIQRWFFAHEFADPNHWNQAFIFRCTEPLDRDALQRAIQALAQHHAAFRTRFSAGMANVVANAPAMVDAPLDIEHGPLLRANCEGDRLLIAAHHLAVDGVSWRILMEDLETAYHQARAGETIALSASTSSVARWSRALAAAAKSNAVRGELNHWQSLAAQAINPLPTDHDRGENSESSARTITVALDTAETETLLQGLPAAFDTRINDALLTALVQAFAGWTGERTLLLDIEGHGREEALVSELSGEPPCDLSRTIGWFTTIFPIRISLNETEANAAILSIRDQLRTIPHRGLGFGLLSGESLAANSEVLFNYLGQFESALGESKLFELTSDDTGPWHGPRNRRTHLLEINCLVIGGRLQARWTYSENLHRAETIDRLANRFITSLRALTALASIRNPKSEIRNSPCPLSPMQRLFHTLESAQPNIGFDQWHCLLRGPLDEARLERAWREVFARHTILRTVFEADESGEPRQHVLDAIVPHLHREDWRALDAAAQADRLDAFLRDDRARGFRLDDAPLTRLALLRLRDEEWRFVWSHHHLQIDGWSWPLIFREVSALYGGETIPPVRPYRDFIDWQQRRPLAASESFWRKQLRGFTAPTPLPQASIPPQKGSDFIEQRAAITASLQETARQSQVTVNVLVQAAWALLLARHSGRSDIVFGASFSGRPTDLDGVENIAGPFVNNLPVRVVVDPAEPLTALLRRIHASLFTLSEHQFDAITQIQSWSEVPWQSRLFDSLLVFQNYLVEDSARRLGGDVRIDDLVAPVRTNYPLTIVATPGAAALDLVAIGAATQFDTASLTAVLAQLTTILEAIARGATSVESLLALLPVPAQPAQAAPRARSATFVAPQTPLEHAIAAVWREAFRTEQVGVQDNFFDLGGHSLLMIQVHARLREALRRDISIVRMFQHPTIQSLARHLDGGTSAAPAIAAAQARAERQKAALLARQRGLSTKA